MASCVQLPVATSHHIPHPYKVFTSRAMKTSIHGLCVLKEEVSFSKSEHIMPHVLGMKDSDQYCDPALPECVSQSPFRCILHLFPIIPVFKMFDFLYKLVFSLLPLFSKYMLGLLSK